MRKTGLTRREPARQRAAARSRCSRIPPNAASRRRGAVRRQAVGHRRRRRAAPADRRPGHGGDPVPERRRVDRAPAQGPSREQRAWAARRTSPRASSAPGRDRAHRPDGAAAVRTAACRRSVPPREAFLEACQEAGIQAEIPDDIVRGELGEVRLPGRRCRAPPRSARAPLGVVRADPDLRWLFEQAMRETWTRRPRARRGARRRLRRGAA